MKHALQTVYFHEGTSFHMQGKNFGNKVSQGSGAAMVYDDEAKEIHIAYNGKTSGMSSLSAKNWDYSVTPSNVEEYFNALKDAGSVGGHPLVRRGQSQATPEPAVIYGEDDESPEAHRARVRAASANSNRSTVAVNTDSAIQNSRLEAMGLKSHTTTQVHNAQQVGEATSVAGKKKAINHTQLRTQIAQEAKDPNA